MHSCEFNLNSTFCRNDSAAGQRNRPYPLRAGKQGDIMYGLIILARGILGEFGAHARALLKCEKKT